MPINLREEVFVAKNTPTVDAKYGPWASKQEAFDSLGPDGDDVLAIGLTVGIQPTANDPVTEYWFKDACETVDDLVEKNDGGGGGGGDQDIQSVLNNGNTVTNNKTLLFTNQTTGNGTVIYENGVSVGVNNNSNVMVLNNTLQFRDSNETKFALRPWGSSYNNKVQMSDDVKTAFQKVLGIKDELFYITVDVSSFNPSASDPNVLEMELASPYTIAELNTILANAKPESMVLRIVTTEGTSKSVNDIVMNYMSQTGYEGDLFLTSVYGGTTHKYAKFIIVPENGKTMLRMYQGNISGGGSDGGTIDVVPGDDKVTVSDPDGLNSATFQVGGAGVLMDISGSQVAELANKEYVDSKSGGGTELGNSMFMLAMPSRVRLTTAAYYDARVEQPTTKSYSSVSKAKFANNLNFGELFVWLHDYDDDYLYFVLERTAQTTTTSKCSTPGYFTDARFTVSLRGSIDSTKFKVKQGLADDDENYWYWGGTPIPLDGIQMDGGEIINYDENNEFVNRIIPRVTRGYLFADVSINGGDVSQKLGNVFQNIYIDVNWDGQVTSTNSFMTGFKFYFKLPRKYIDYLDAGKYQS